jgi:hypothetical protein
MAAVAELAAVAAVVVAEVRAVVAEAAGSRKLPSPSSPFFRDEKGTLYSAE